MNKDEINKGLEKKYPKGEITYYVDSDWWTVSVAGHLVFKAKTEDAKWCITYLPDKYFA